MSEYVPRIQPVRFTHDDVNRAFDEWGCNCGPAALAAVCGLSLPEVRLHMGDFESKHYTNPTLMKQAVKSVGVRYSIYSISDFPEPLEWPVFGLARIQWEGPWTRPGVPMRVRYRHTHWVGAAKAQNGSRGIFDVNCVNNGSGWVALEEWVKVAVPWLLKECVPRADGKWHITHAIEVSQ